MCLRRSNFLMLVGTAVVEGVILRILSVVHHCDVHVIISGARVLSRSKLSNTVEG